MKRNLHVVAALAAALAFGSLVAPASAAPLQQFTQQDLQAPTQTTIVVVTGDCAACGPVVSALEAQADKHTGIKFTRADAKELGVPDHALPLVAVIVPGASVTYVKETFAVPADMDAWTASRIDFATKQAAAATKVTDLQSQIEAAQKPFEDQAAQNLADMMAALKPLQEKATADTADLRAQMDDLTKRRQAALTPIFEERANATNEAEWNAANAKLQAANAPFATERQEIQAKIKAIMDPLRAQAEPIMKPFQDKAVQIEKDMEAAIAPLNAQLATAEADLQKLLEDGQK